MISEQTLDEFRARLVESGAPVAERLRPGLSPDALDQLTQPLGITLPTEAKQWFGWQNGVPFEDGSVVTAGTLGGFWLAPVERLVDECLMMREVYEDLYDEPNAPGSWRSDWFPLVDSDSRTQNITLVCSEGKRAEVVCFDAEDTEKPPSLSLESVVEQWSHALRVGVWRWNAARGFWDHDLELRAEEFPNPELRSFL